MSRYFELVRGAAGTPPPALPPAVERRWWSGRPARRAALAAGVLLALTIAGAWLQPSRYEGRVKLLLTRDRLDSAVSPTREDVPAARMAVSGEELQSEAQVVRSRDLLERVVGACRLRVSAAPRAGLIDRPVLELERRVMVEVGRRSNVLTVSYAHEEAATTACVLNTLANAYVEKHLALRRPRGALAFFQRETAAYQDALAAAEAKLAGFMRAAGAPAVELERELRVRTLEEIEQQLRETRAALATTTGRVDALRRALAAAPPRQVTDRRTADNAQLLQQLRSTLLTLELKRTELLTRYSADYRLVQEVDAQLAQARDAIAYAERSPVRDETTSNDPAYEWLRTELTRSSTELESLAAREAALQRIAGTYKGEARALAQKATVYQELLREVKTQEENYLLYRRKQEEARISDALDRQRIANVVIAEPANVPAEPRSWRAAVLVAGTFLSLLAGGLVFWFERRGWWRPADQRALDARREDRGSASRKVAS